MCIHITQVYFSQFDSILSRAKLDQDLNVQYARLESTTLNELSKADYVKWTT